MAAASGDAHLAALNAAQRAAVEYAAPPPLLIIAGAGTGKTMTLAHRVAHLVLNGADPERLLLLTFTRRAALELTRRAERICAAALAGRRAGARLAPGGIAWSGTFHGIANRLLRLHAAALGLDPAFTVLDRADAADLMDLERHELGLTQLPKRFPRKDTCLAIYSQAVNARDGNSRGELAAVLERDFPWCAEWAAELRSLFGAYAAAKQRDNVLDYDDLLLCWSHMMAEPATAAEVARRFDHVLVDEYQDTNPIQAAILRGLRPSGTGLTVVGDDAQSIYSFRAATVRNILDFPGQYAPPATVLKLEQNYRSTEPILAAANAVISGAGEGFAKRLFSGKLSQEKPRLVTTETETGQVDYVVARILEHREAGILLKRQAVLFRTGHHSDQLEVELARRNIPFVKYGGLKFLEAAHVKDVLSVLRWAENPRDAVAGFRLLQLLPGIGPATARRAIEHGAASGHGAEALAGFAPPPAAAEAWPALARLMALLRRPDAGWDGQVAAVRHWYQPHLERRYDFAPARANDLDQLEQIAATYASRGRFLSELALDPPEATGVTAAAPLLDEDYLVLSTIHSAKGQEWDAVYVLNLADGCLPSDMAAGRPEQIEEERRLLYVAMTRAREHLDLVHPQRFFRRQQHRHGDHYLLAPRSRFLPEAILDRFERHAHRGPAGRGPGAAAPARGTSSLDLRSRLREMWR